MPQGLSLRSDDSAVDFADGPEGVTVTVQDKVSWEKQVAHLSEEHAALLHHWLGEVLGRCPATRNDKADGEGEA